MIQQVRQNPELMFSFCSIPGLDSKELPEWSSMDGAFKAVVQQNQPPLLNKDQYYCKECNSPVQPRYETMTSVIMPTTFELPFFE